LQIIGGFPVSFAVGSHDVAAMAANTTFEDRIRDISEFLVTGQRLEKFFPSGITKISLAVKVGGAESDLKFRGRSTRSFW